MNRHVLLDTFTEIVGAEGVITDDARLGPYCQDWRGIFHGRALCALLPRTTSEVASIVRLCAQADVELVPQGGNTGLSGGATPDTTGRQVVLSLARMKAIRHIDVIGETMEVEAGCILQHAQEAATERDLHLPIELASEGSAQVGGIVSTNAGGTNVLRYGMARSRILGLEVVTADGQILSGLRLLRKDNAGFDWKQWFIGTEGTLGIVTAVVLQLVQRSKYRVTAMLAVNTPEQALSVLKSAKREIGETLSGFELMSGSALKRVRKHMGLTLPLEDAPWFVLLEASSSISGLKSATESLLETLLENETVSNGVIAESERQEAELWHLRESITEAESKEGKSIKHDVSVPISSIPEFLSIADAAVSRAFPGVLINAFGHAGDGNIHYNLIVGEGLDTTGLNQLVHDTVISFGGSISAEHGIGQYRVSELSRCKSESEIAIARAIKRALDPQNRLNPGKVLGRE
jgi:FAD/FMN-containing dehydrogenase